MTAEIAKRIRSLREEERLLSEQAATGSTCAIRSEYRRLAKQKAKEASDLENEK